MPDTTYYRSKLLAKRDEVRQRIALLPGRLAIEHVADPMDAVVGLQQREATAEDSRRDRQLLADIETALARINLGVFGECSTCDGPIADRRLEAVPWSADCIRCASRREKMEKADVETY